MKGTHLEEVLEPPRGEIESAVRNLRDWISKQPHLPKVADDEFLTTFFYNNKFSLEKTKSKLDNYYSLRNKYPHLMKNRDPIAPGIKAFGPNVSVSRDLTSNGARLMQLRFDPDPDPFNMDDYIRYVSMILDMLILEKDRLVTYVFVLDLRNFSYRHFLKMVAGMKEASELFLKAYTERVESIRVINAPSYIELCINTLLNFFPQKYAKRICVHRAPSDLLEVIDVDVVPRDLGGKGRSFEECGAWTLEKIGQYRDWFKEQSDVCSDETHRRRDENHPEEMIGSFRKLEVD